MQFKVAALWARVACCAKCLCLVAWGDGPQRCEYSLRGEVLKPATELAMKKSAICLRASRPVGLFPFRCCSWIRLSNSSLKAWKEKERKSWERKHDTEMMQCVKNKKPNSQISLNADGKAIPLRPKGYNIKCIILKACFQAWKWTISVMLHQKETFKNFTFSHSIRHLIQVCEVK